ncbi:oligosaccharide flippase family protein [Methylonatrum kenyense]|uniref:lipopolysaccharide biosynthesis protein n=1 Tax=Methylonatrum kenyense TaxID=455253 RepID=UPI0020BF1991|nr:oligosaccharide flippase family protein [Methylonatrum kenyense]MCK8514767.1 oligosaccharide flippase family protein [Methylonatrum kenyense]
MGDLARLGSRFLQDLARRPFVRDVAMLATGTAASQAIMMAFAPLITRLYGPEAFGLNSIFLSLVAPLCVLATLSYPIAIVLPERERDARILVRLALALGAVMALLISVGLYFAGQELLVILNAGAIAAFMYLIPVAVFVAVLGDVMGHWLIRRKAFAIAARYKAYTALLVNGAKSGLGLIHPTAMVLIVTNTLGNLVGTTLTYLRWRKEARGRTEPNVPTAAGPQLTTLAMEHRDFPLLRTPQNLINILSRSLPLLLLAAFFDAGAAGQYAIAMAVLALPSALIGSSVLSVFYPRVNEAKRNDEDVRGLIIKATVGMAAVGALPFLVIIIAGPALFQFVFGAEWRTAGVYSQWLSLWLFFGFVNRPAVGATPVLKLQGFLLTHEVISVTLRVMALYIGFLVLDDAVSGIAIFSLVGMLLNIWLIHHVVRASKQPEPHDE